MIFETSTKCLDVGENPVEFLQLEHKKFLKQNSLTINNKIVCRIFL